MATTTTRKPRATTKAAKPEPVEADEESGNGRGPGTLHTAMAQYLNETHGGNHDPLTVYLAQTQRKAFRASPAYAAIKSEQDAASAKRAEAKAAREAAKTEPKAEAEKKPAAAKRAAGSKTAVAAKPDAATTSRRRTGTKAAAATGTAAKTNRTAPKTNRTAPF
jgi:hypothetical protein